MATVGRTFVSIPRKRAAIRDQLSQIDGVEPFDLDQPGTLGADCRSREYRRGTRQAHAAGACRRWRSRRRGHFTSTSRTKSTRPESPTSEVAIASEPLARTVSGRTARMTHRPSDGDAEVIGPDRLDTTTIAARTATISSTQRAKGKHDGDDTSTVHQGGGHVDRGRRGQRADRSPRARGSRAIRRNG